MIMKITMTVEFCPAELPEDNPYFEEYHDLKEIKMDVHGKFEVCGRCNGKGRHPNPSIDGNGISMEEFSQDPDFAEAYFSGAYDVTCEHCQGQRVMPDPDYDAIDRDPVLKPIFDQMEDMQASIDEMNAIYEAERRMGA